jgi:predicted DnaQ family exonuclease/DinG family helicase
VGRPATATLSMDASAQTAAVAGESGQVAAIGWLASGGRARPGGLTEIAAVVLDHGVVVARCSERVGPADALAPAVATPPGITPEQVRPARPAAAVLADLLAFLPPAALCVAHNVPGLLAALPRGVTIERPVLDTLSLAGICFSEQPSFALDALQQALGLPDGSTDRAGPRAEVTAQLWLRLESAALALPRPVLQGLARLLRGVRKDPLRELFRAAAEAASPDRRPLAAVFAEHPQPRRPAPVAGRPTTSLDADAIGALLDPEGPLAAGLGQYEYRHEQVRMAQAVVQAFNLKHHLLVEAGTGVGKSVAYLVPAILWAVINESPVVVSTNTKNLQAQLFEKDLPLLARALEAEVRFAMIKGRRNYLCIRKLLYLISHADTELERDDRLPLASVLVWATQTRSGDITESIVGDRPHLGELTSRITSVAEECGGPECEHRRRCFLQRARRLALTADVVVANHAVVFGELSNPLASPVLPPHRQLVLDEAHNLEDAVTSAMSREVSMRRARFVLTRLYRGGARRRARGLIPSLQRQVGKAGRLAAEGRSAVLGTAADAVQALQAAAASLSPFFEAMAALLRAAGESQPRRIDSACQASAFWTAIAAAQRRLVDAVTEAARATTALADSLVRLAEDLPPALAEFDRELRATALWLGEFSHDVDAVLGAQEPGWVCWIEPAPPVLGGAQAWGAPIEVGPLLQEHLYGARDSIVFTSATLTVNGATEFVRHRLGLDLLDQDRVDTLMLGTVFDYARQCLVLVPTFLPEPDEPGRDFAAELAGFLTDLFRETRGRGMALFTSHEMLRRCAGPLGADLLASGIRVLSQGLSGSRESMLRRLKADPQTVLLGAHSFWEGVDVVGENLSCLVLARLPFAVHTDPIIAARCEAIAAQGGNAFMEYTLPGAVIRFRQGFGRLIRHRTDRGVVIVADRRIVSKRYGEWFRASIPAGVTRYDDPGALLAAVRDFLAG